MSAAGFLHDVLMPPVTNLSPGERLLSAFLGAAMVTAALPRSRWAPVAAGAALLLRAGSGYCPVTHALSGGAAASSRRLSGRRGTHVKVQATIGQPPAAVYAVWRQLDQLARAMPETVRIQRLDDAHSRWTLLTPGGRTLATWTAELINDIPERLLAWRTTSTSAVVSAGSVQFAQAPADQGTEVRVHLQFSPPFGRLGSGLATLSGHDATRLVRRGLDDVKRYLELGRRPTLSA